MARCPNCARKVHFWHNYSGYCSKQCRTDSVTSCPNCGKVGLYKHARLGCCSEDCRYWYVAGLLGYDKDALLTPAWDKIVYHVRLPSGSAEISSLQLDELEYDRAIDTVLVIAAPPWMTRSKVLAELPYDRFDNTAWQHLWADGTLTEEELYRFHRLCYEEDILCQKVGEHVYAKLRQPAQVYNTGAQPTVALYDVAPTPLLATARQQTTVMPQARISAASLPPSTFVDNVRALFEARGYTTATGAAENTLLLQRNGRIALAAYQYHTGMVDVDPVQRALAAGSAVGATQTYVVTNGHFTLQAEDFASTHPMQLVDGDELADLVAHRQGVPTLSETPAAETTGAIETTRVENGNGGNGNGRNAAHADRTEVMNAVEVRGPEPRDQRSQQQAGGGVSFAPPLAPVEAEIIGGEA